MSIYIKLNIIITSLHFISSRNLLTSKNISHSTDLNKFEVRSKTAHGFRKNIIRSSIDLFGPDVEDAYKCLEEVSYLARYNCYSDCVDDIQGTNENLKCLMDHILSNYKVDLTEPLKLT